MSEFTVLEEEPISLVDLKGHLDQLGKEGELSFRAEKTKEYLEKFVVESAADMEKYASAILELGVPRLKRRHVVKVLDVMPTDLDSLRLLFSNEALTIKEEDLKKILDVIPQ